MVESFLILGQILVGGYFLLMGVNHFANLGAISGYAASKGVPLPDVGAVFSGGILILASINLLFGYRVPVSLILIWIFLFTMSFTVHTFWEEKDPRTREAEKIQFSKNMGLLGAISMLIGMIV